MIGIAAFAEVASLIGDPARANMLFALKEDGQLSAGDLSSVAGVAPSTASEHLAKLSAAGMVTMTARGRRRYYRLADPAVADVLEGVDSLAGRLTKREARPLRWDQATIHARRCLDHLAGSVGSRLAGAMMAKGFIGHSPDGPDVTDAGADWLASLGIDVGALRAAPRRFLGLCPDWIEETPHIGGAVGSAMLKGLISHDWLRRAHGARHLVQVTPRGVAEFRAQLGLDVRAAALTPGG